MMIYNQAEEVNDLELGNGSIVNLQNCKPLLPSFKKLLCTIEFRNSNFNNFFGARHINKTT